MGAKSKLKSGAAGDKKGKPPLWIPGWHGQPATSRASPPPGTAKRRSSQCRVPSSPGDARGEAPCIRKTKISPFPLGRGSGGWGQKSKLKAGAAGGKEGKPPAGCRPRPPSRRGWGKPPAGHEICFLLWRLKINPVAVAFFEKPLAFLRKIWYNTIQSCTVACSCARKPARV